MHDFANREAAAGSEIDRHTLAAAKQQPGSGHMRAGEIADMNVVTYRRSIMSRIVVAEYFEIGQAADCSENRAGYEMSLRIVTFASQPHHRGRNHKR